MPMTFGKAKAAMARFTFILPALAFFTFIVVIPAIRGIMYSFTNWDGISKTYNYIGFKNYLRLLTDVTFIKPLGNTMQYTALTLIFNNVFGILFAVGAHSISKRVSNAFKAVIFMPFVISPIFAAYIWQYIYALVFFPLFHIRNLLSMRETVMLGISIMATWRDTGFCMVLYYAAIKNVPEELYEAAIVDGARAVQRFFRITIPMIVPSITVCVSLFLGFGLKVFDYIMAATAGGPGNASETIAFYVYRYTFPYYKAGYGQAAAVVMTLAIYVLTGIVVLQLRKREVEL